jgi:hypothetical protein
MSIPKGGPLRDLGPATRACLTAGLVEEEPRVEPSCYKEEAEFIVGEGLAGIAFQLARNVPGADPATVEWLRRVTFETQLRSMAAMLAARRIFQRLNDKFIPVVVIKGPAVERYHPLHWPRTYGDVDVLVSAGDYPEVIRVCQSELFTDPASTPPWPWFDRICKEGVNLHSHDGGNIDVHHHVPPWVFGRRLTAENVIASSSVGTLSDLKVRLASLEHSLVIASLHVLNDLWRGRSGLVSWRDIIVLLRNVGMDRAVEVFTEVGLTWLLDLVTVSLRSYLPEAAVPVRAAAHGPPFDIRTRIAVLGWDNDSTLSRHRVSFAARLPVANALAFIGGCVLPQRRYVYEYYDTYRNYWRRLVGETVSTVHGDDPRMSSTQMVKRHDGFAP